MTYKTFISLFLTTIVAFAIIFANTQNTIQVGLGIITLAIIVDTLCLLRLKKLGFSTREAFKRLYFYGYKFRLLFNQIKK